MPKRSLTFIERAEQIADEIKAATEAMRVRPKRNRKRVDSDQKRSVIRKIAKLFHARSQK